MPSLSHSGGRFARRLSSLAVALATPLFLASALPALTVDFGDVTLSPSSYYNGGPTTNSAGWTSGGASFSNSFTDFGGGFSAWAGFSYSNTADTTTAGFGNQYSAYALTTANSGVYGVVYHSAYDPVPTITFDSVIAPQSILLTNTTYAALDMLNGTPGVSKKFGGVSGNDGDWLKVTFTGYDANNVFTDDVDFYLADYRDPNNAFDYIVSDWTTVDLTGLGTNVKSIKITLSSSDVGMFGINTPTYLAIDNLAYFPIPEPATCATLAGAAFLGCAALRRRRQGLRA